MSLEQDAVVVASAGQQQQHSSVDRLTQAALEAHTVRHPPSSRSTVEAYLRRSLPFAGQYESVGVTPLSPTKAVPPLASTARKRLLAQDSGNRDENCALVLHHSDFDEHELGRRKSRKLESSDPAPSKKQSLVKAMKPRASAQQHASNTNTQPDPQGRGKARSSADKGKTVSSKQPKASTSTARIDGAREPELDIYENKDVYADIPGQKTRRARSTRAGARERPGSHDERDTTTVDHKGKRRQSEREATDRVSSSMLKEQDKDDQSSEAEQRRAARRERRRAKALVVKDKTLSAAETGRSAAQSLRKKRRANQMPATESDKPSTDSDEQGRKKSKRKRSKATERAVWQLQEQQRPKGILQGRLTLKPAVKVGVFSKGVASVRTRASTSHANNFAFSEVAFLSRAQNGSRQQQSTSSSEELPFARLPEQANKSDVHRLRSGKIGKRDPASGQDPSSVSHHFSPPQGQFAPSQQHEEAPQVRTSTRLRGPSTMPLKRRSERLKHAQTSSSAPDHPTSSLLPSSLHSAYVINRRVRSTHKNESGVGGAGDSLSQFPDNDDTIELDTSRFFSRPADVVARHTVATIRHDSQRVRDAGRCPELDGVVSRSNDFAFRSRFGTSSSSIQRLLLACEQGLVPQSVDLQDEDEGVEQARGVGYPRISSEQWRDNLGHTELQHDYTEERMSSSRIDSDVEPFSQEFAVARETDSSPCHFAQPSSSMPDDRMFVRERHVDADDEQRGRQGVSFEASRAETGGDDKDEFRKAMNDFWYRTVL
ncbi:hypothetical protein ACM66B_005746 [Microbotryomycetes sp. NB124-2]